MTSFIGGVLVVDSRFGYAHTPISLILTALNRTHTRHDRIARFDDFPAQAPFV